MADFLGVLRSNPDYLSSKLSWIIPGLISGPWSNVLGWIFLRSTVGFFLRFFLALALAEEEVFFTGHGNIYSEISKQLFFQIDMFLLH